MKLQNTFYDNIIYNNLYEGKKTTTLVWPLWKKNHRICHDISIIHLVACVCIYIYIFFISWFIRSFVRSFVHLLFDVLHFKINWRLNFAMRNKYQIENWSIWCWMTGWKQWCLWWFSCYLHNKNFSLSIFFFIPEHSDSLFCTIIGVSNKKTDLSHVIFLTRWFSLINFNADAFNPNTFHSILLYCVIFFLLVFFSCTYFSLLSLFRSHWLCVFQNSTSKKKIIRCICVYKCCCV